MNKLYCVFHILSGNYIYCHKVKWPDMTSKTYLLDIGTDHRYDSNAIILVDSDPAILWDIIRSVINNETQHYSNRVLAEFEIHDFSYKLVPEEYAWRYKDRIYV